jgi:hypothetical protein
MIGTGRPPSAERVWHARGRELANAARIKRNAWILAALALACYVGFIAWNVVRSSAGG